MICDKCKKEVRKGEYNWHGKNLFCLGCSREQFYLPDQPKFEPLNKKEKE